MRLSTEIPDLTPRHDAIVIWLKENIDQLIEEGIVQTRSTGWGKNRIEESRKHANEAYSGEVKSIEDSNRYLDRSSKYRKQSLPPWPGLGVPPMEPPARIGKAIWEYQVRTERGFPIGYIDLLLPYTAPTLYVDNIRSGYGYNQGYRLVDEKLPKWAVVYQDERLVAFEAKPSIPSVGEVIRQIRKYQQLCKAEYYVVAPDDSLAKYFRDQEIGFIKCP